MSDSFNFKSEAFDGPLDLLLTLIQKNKVNIYDIPIAEILEQYLDYIDDMSNISGEFIIMAAELIYIKSKMLLPREEEEGEDPRDELVNALLEYKKFKEAAEFLALRRENFNNRFNSPAMKPIITKVTPIYNAGELYDIMAYLRAARREQRELDKKSSVSNVIKAPQVSIEEKIIYVLRALVRSSISFGKPVKFSALFAPSKSRSEVVACFLALLELMKSGRISVDKEEGDYSIRLLEKTKA